MKKINEYTTEEIEQEFVKYFGEEKLEEEKILTNLIDLITPILHQYLSLELIPIVFDETLKDNCNGLYHIEENAIFLNPKIKNNKVQLLETLCHEVEHYYQVFYINNFNTPKAKRWLELFKTRNSSDLDELEIDAYAFSQVVLGAEFHIEYKHSIEEVQFLICDYIYQKKLLSDD